MELEIWRGISDGRSGNALISAGSAILSSAAICNKVSNSYKDPSAISQIAGYRHSSPPDCREPEEFGTSGQLCARSSSGQLRWWRWRVQL